MSGLLERSGALKRCDKRNSSGWRKMHKPTHLTPLELIKALNATDPYIATIFLEGGCYQFHLFLKKLYPDSIPVINKTSNHVGTLIEKQCYDITGLVNWEYRKLNEQEIKTVEQWSFAKKNLLLLGECPFCEEPLVK